ncbi:D-alanyl-D-alanine carboxypeptidase PBP3 [Streptococcus parauberis]|uniref:D-alanyl-D-alanine carboxypeptidase PBP3 n=1 Tax=Streptococcus parauberis TaxID=1348 RepID=UPI00056029E7|nr:D-alanyl-D-alanine carboxypeptidase PBP3 [Streptococcus parauberis]UWM87334.1 D-alanyl-D-alanine carboxypeptidase PBP3 [Streptococcus parauberis]UWM89306.1 D-alanyl-D-alanine carboxypeptidase PBP3 [Streptococcus parauberis]WEM60027.1 D-alanyl-D-alanine carboxypeptidase PBP3 [Streptococcus parauberis]
MKKFIVILILTMSLLVTFSAQTVFAADFSADSRHAIAVESDTGKILYEKSGNKKAPIASLTKLLTIYITLKEIKAGKISWNDQVKLSEYAQSLATDPEISNPPLTSDTYSVKELVDSSLIVSANSSAIALAEHIAGSEPKFVDMMKKQVEQWGITDYLLVDSSGLPNSLLKGHTYPGSSPKDENMLSAKSLAIIAYHLIHDFPEVLQITSQPQMIWGYETLYSSNYLLPGQEMGRAGVDGLKTGTTNLAGQTYIATATENNMRLITVLLHANHTKEDHYARFTQTNQLLDYCFQNYQKKLMVKKDQPLPNRIAVENGKKDKISIKTKTNIYAIHKINTAPKLSFKSKNKLVAPIKKNQFIGTYEFNDQDTIGEGYLFGKTKTKVYASTTVDKLTVFDKIYRLFKNF